MLFQLVIIEILFLWLSNIYHDYQTFSIEHDYQTSITFNILLPTTLI